MSFGNMENLQEERVFALVRELLDLPEHARVCKCENCFIDISALALNMLPGEYVADKFYKFPDKPEIAEAKRQKALEAIREAIRKVSAHPHHE